MSEYKRLTTNNLEEYDPEYDFCIECKYFGEPNGCNRPNGTCDSYDRFMETYNRLVELEDKIENGTLIDTKVKVGQSVYRRGFFKGEIDEYIVSNIILENGQLKIHLKHDLDEHKTYYLETVLSIEEIGKTIFLTKAEAEARLKELDNSYKENR